MPGNLPVQGGEHVFKFVHVVRPGRVIFEVEGVDAATAKEAFTRAHHKLPIKTALVARGSAL